MQPSNSRHHLIVSSSAHISCCRCTWRASSTLWLGATVALMDLLADANHPRPLSVALWSPLARSWRWYRSRCGCPQTLQCVRRRAVIAASWCSHSSRLLALMWFARWVLIIFIGSTPRDPKKVLPPRRPTDQHHAISTSATRDALRRVPLARRAADPSPSLIQWLRTPALDIGERDDQPRRRNL